MSDEEDELRRMLAARADRVHSSLSGPAIRARAEARRPVRRYAPLLTAAAVLAVAVISIVLLQHGESGPAQVPPAAPVTTSSTVTVSPPSTVTSPQMTVTTHSQVSSSPMTTTETTTSN
ncbi:hypothetical protein [Kutzneria kofuensis]|uniref:Uncharacterized protein n=1 Tax=Kutzneria kofuensis TaxID=103725 RepID=A0A7W9KBC8_9PSEU|nr:hypothetical protein [Kutzneria kofuensis]MBB5889485.1 hypothetical protein [Kutzneria kofuensis]